MLLWHTRDIERIRIREDNNINRKMLRWRRHMRKKKKKLMSKKERDSSKTTKISLIKM